MKKQKKEKKEKRQGAERLIEPRFDLGTCGVCGREATVMVARQLNAGTTLAIRRCDDHCITQRDADAVLCPMGVDGDRYWQSA